MLPVAWHVVGGALFVAGCALVIWAIAVNSSFSTTVRLQADQGQTVCRAGSYRFVRHPGYLGMIAYQAGTPLLLGSLWAFVPTGLAIVLFAIRTGLEDRMLRHKLAGYTAYAASVRYLLLPWIW